MESGYVLVRSGYPKHVNRIEVKMKFKVGPNGNEHRITNNYMEEHLHPAIAEQLDLI